MTSTEVDGIERSADGSFVARVRRKTTFVDPEACIGCGECERACTVAIADRYNFDLVASRAIHIAFPQAVPKKAVIASEGISPCTYTCPGGRRGARLRVAGARRPLRRGVPPAHGGRAAAGRAEPRSAMRRARGSARARQVEGTIEIRGAQALHGRLLLRPASGAGIRRAGRPQRQTGRRRRFGAGGPDRGLFPGEKRLRGRRSSKPRPRWAGCCATPRRPIACRGRCSTATCATSPRSASRSGHGTEVASDRRPEGAGIRRRVRRPRDHEGEGARRSRQGSRRRHRSARVSASRRSTARSTSPESAWPSSAAAASRSIRRAWRCAAARSEVKHLLPAKPRRKCRRTNPTCRRRWTKASSSHELRNPTRFVGQNGKLTAVALQETKLGAPDASKRPAPEPVAEFGARKSRPTW